MKLIILMLFLIFPLLVNANNIQEESYIETVKSYKLGNKKEAIAYIYFKNLKYKEDDYKYDLIIYFDSYPFNLSFDWCAEKFETKILCSVHMSIIPMQKLKKEQIFLEIRSKQHYIENFTSKDGKTNVDFRGVETRGLNININNVNKKEKAENPEIISLEDGLSLLGRILNEEKEAYVNNKFEKEAKINFEVYFNFLNNNN